MRQPSPAAVRERIAEAALSESENYGRSTFGQCKEDLPIRQRRRKEEEKVSPTADVKIKKTGKDNQVLIKVENIEHLKKGLQSITAAVWKNEDQSDLQWVNLAVFENGICKTKVDLSNYEPMQGEYNVHIYIIDGKGDAHNVAGTTFEIK